MEKKKIAPKKIQPVAAEAAPFAPEKPVLSAEAQEKALAAVQRSERKAVAKTKPRKVEGPKNVQRVTVDFPLYLYDQMKDETDKLGESLRNFVVLRVREYFEKKSA